MSSRGRRRPCCNRPADDVTRRLAIVATHPIQYYSALYRELATRAGIDVTVFYAHRPSAAEQGAGFGVAFEWDIDLLSGYQHRFLRNRAARPDVERFRGCDTPEIAQIVRDGGWDAVLVMGWQVQSFWQAMRAAWSARIPVLVRGDSQLPNDAVHLKRVVKRLLYPLFVRRFEACLAVGTRSAEYFRYYGARRIVRSPHFVDNARFAAAAEHARPARDAIRRRWDIPEDAIVVLFAGKFIEKKHPLDALRAVHASGMKDVHLLLVGDGVLRAACEREAQALRGRAHFAGFLNQSAMPDAYAASDVLVLPSDARETWGLVVNEAMASGLPALVCREAGCAPDLIVEGVTGHAFALGAVEDIGRRIAELAADPARCVAMGRAAAARASEYSVERAADGVLGAMGIQQAKVA